MKAKMYSQKDHSYLFDHVLDGFATSHAGIEQLRAKNLIGEAEYTELLQRNSARLIDRIKEFKLLQRLLCVTFAAIFTWMQLSNQDIEMRCSSRVRLRPRREDQLSQKSL